AGCPGRRVAGRPRAPGRRPPARGRSSQDQTKVEEGGMSVAIQAEGLAKSFGTTRALDGVDLEVAAGTVLGLLGPNGAGKKTAGRILAPLFGPPAGRSQVGGYDVVRQPQQVRQLIGLTGQYAAVDENLSGTENLYM